MDEPAVPEPTGTLPRSKSSKLFDKLNSENLKKHNTTSFKKAIIWICGIEKFLDESHSSQRSESKIDTSIEQDPFWKNFCDVNAVIALGLCGFCYAFFNKFD
jgi:hypothetical protein